MLSGLLFGLGSPWRRSGQFAESIPYGVLGFVFLGLPLRYSGGLDEFLLRPSATFYYGGRCGEFLFS